MASGGDRSISGVWAVQGPWRLAGDRGPVDRSSMIGIAAPNLTPGNLMDYNRILTSAAVLATLSFIVTPAFVRQHSRGSSASRGSALAGGPRASTGPRSVPTSR